MNLGTDAAGFCVLCMGLLLLKLQKHGHGELGLSLPDSVDLQQLLVNAVNKLLIGSGLVSN